jgi:hypothetical protein
MASRESLLQHFDRGAGLSQHIRQAGSPVREVDEPAFDRITPLGKSVNGKYR